MSDPPRVGAIDSIGVGMLGYAFMGKAHANAYRTLSYMTWPPPLLPRLVAVAGRDPDAVEDARDRYGFDTAFTDWRDLVSDDRWTLFDNSGPNALHGEPTIAGAQAGKHVICEKPLGRDAYESYEIWQRVAATGVTHMCGFNYRFVPAIRLVREMIESGDLGEIRHFRARYLQSWATDAALMTWRFERGQAGSGALGDLGAHIIDLGRYLVGEVGNVTGLTRTFIDTRAGSAVDVDDAFQATVEFETGATGTLEASRLCPGRLNQLALEVNGSRGSISFDLERLNELAVCREEAREPGFQRILVTEPHHPFMSFWWPPGHTIGWEHTFVHELHHLLSAIAGTESITPHGADFEDGYRAAEICEAILRSNQSGQREALTYHGAGPSG